jgi:uncharacterized protein YbjT (DUF2867 family)
MKILLTGATGYIGKRLLPVLLQQGHQVVCCVRDKNRFPAEDYAPGAAISLFEVDFLKPLPDADAIEDIDAAYYLIHSMSTNVRDFERLEEQSARNFLHLVEATKARQIIYLGGITNDRHLSKHLASRKNVEDILGNSRIPLTAVRAGIIVGSGSASFEIIRDLVEKLPVMVAPRWLNTKSQPIAIRNVIQYLTGVLLKEETMGEGFDIGGPEVLSYKEMLLQYAGVRGLKRYIYIVPVMTPRLSSYWLYFVTSTSYKLAVNLVNSMKVEVVAGDNRLEKLLGIQPASYKEAVSRAFQQIEQNVVVSSWKDALISSDSGNLFPAHINVPVNGCFVDKREKPISGDTGRVLENIWSIGGERGWYYADWLWNLRGVLDKMFGGVGLRRGRTSPSNIHAGDTLDFWRVLAADKHNKRLLLYAEMKLPGEAWLEFRIIEHKGKSLLRQTATFRPKGLAGRLYWYTVMPFHFFVFDGMAENIVKYQSDAG